MRSLGRTLVSVLLVSCFCSSISHAGWIENGVPLTRQWGASGPGVIASGGAIAYRVCREGVCHLVAQSLNYTGEFLWGPDGVDVCTARGFITEYQITRDAGGGAIVTWVDSNNGVDEIYAQRVNVVGMPVWTKDGVALCTANGSREGVQITADGVGGAIVAWDDSRTGERDIYAQRVNASGSILWTAGGVPICTANGDQYLPKIIAVGGGGAIVTWADYRSGNVDIYAQRVSTLGAVRWTANGVAVCTVGGNQTYHQIVSDGADGAIVTWENHQGGSADIYAQRVTDSGAVRWATGGIPLCTASGTQTYPQIVSREAGGVIVTWEDSRNGDSDLYAQRVDTTGVVQWTSNGVPVCTATSYQRFPHITADGFGGAIVTWRDSDIGVSLICAQRVNAAGAVQWAENGLPLCAASGEQDEPQIASAETGVAIVTWYRFYGEDAGIRAQRVSAGLVWWGSDGVSVCSATADQSGARIISDGTGGAIVAWFDERSGEYEIYGQRLNSLGNIQWPVEGILVSPAPYMYETNLEITTDGAGGAIMTWHDFRNGDADVFAQRVDASGTVQWTGGCVSICTAADGQFAQGIAIDGAGGAIVVWHDSRGVDSDIYAQRLNSLGQIQWPVDGFPVCTASGNQGSPRITSAGGGGAVVIWEDSRSGTDEIYAQRMSASGGIQWPNDGVLLCTAAGNRYSLQVISDGADGAIVTWQDYRSGTADIYAQRISASGDVQWPINGVPLCTAASGQSYPRIATDGANGAIVTWVDYRGGNDGDIYAQRVNAFGVTQWTTDGIPLCTATSYQTEVQITSDSIGGAIVAWSDYRSGDGDIYSQRVNALGDVLWVNDGVSLCNALGDQESPQVTSDGSDGAIIAWYDERCGYWIFAQRIRGSGEIVGTLLQNYSAALDGESIRLAWALSEIDEGARFLVSRALAPGWKYVEVEGAAIVKDKLSFSFTDTDCLPGTTYQYRVECETEGIGRRILFETEQITMPALPLTLYQNHPNPFNPSTVIRFYLPETQEMVLDVFDVAGERVARLVEGKREKGYHEVTWDGRNSSGAICASGVYFSRLKAGKSTISRKMVVAR